MSIEKLRQEVQEILDLLNEVKYLEKERDKQNDYIKRLEAENRKLKYEYPDSKRKRDKPLPYRWTNRGGYLLMFCPKCGMGIANWYSYCHACGQKIAHCNPLPEMEEIEKVENGTD